MTTSSSGFPSVAPPLVLGIFDEIFASTRKTITRYEIGTHRIRFAVQLAVDHLTSASRIPLVGIVAAGDPIEPLKRGMVPLLGLFFALGWLSSC